MRLNTHTKKIYRACVLGFLCMVMNTALAIVWGPSFTLHTGNIFLFCSLLVFGFTGGLISVMTGALPYAIFSSNPGEAVRLLFMCGMIGLLTRKTSKVNGASLAILCWALMLVGVNYLAPNNSQLITFLGLNNPWAFWSDIICVLAAGLVLLDSDTWCRLSDSPRHVPLTALATHVISAIAIVTLCLGYSWTNPAWMTTPLLVSWMAVIQVISVSIGIYSARYIIDNFHSLSRDHLSKKEDTSTFSGLSTGHWRRKEKVEKRVLSKGIWRRPQQIANNITSSEDNNEREGVCVCDIRGTIYFANKPFVDMVGIKTDDFVGKRLDNLGVSEEWYKPIIEIAEHTKEKGPRFKEIKFNSLPNKLRYYELSSRVGTAKTDMIASDNPESIIISIRDITKRRTVSENIVQAQRLESIGQLMNGLAHEFNNSLTAIVAKASMACGNKLSPESAHSTLEEILAYAKKAGETVRGLLDFTDQGLGKVEKVDLCKLVENQLHLLRKLVGATYDISFNRPQEAIGASCNSVLFNQILTNLILNARDAYTDGSGEIRIKLDTEDISQEVSSLPIGVKPGKFCRLMVEHKGAGMNRNVIAKAFDPSESRQSGVGLALSIVFTIVRAHDGFLTAESHPVKGTTISVYLPQVEVKPENEAEKLSYDPESSSKDIENANGKNILVVEDEPVVRELTSFMLADMGYQVKSCDTGTEAVKLAKDTSFDLILVDFVIPKLGGNELIRKLKNINPDTQTLVMTGYGSSVAGEVESSTIINKPFDMETLARAVKDALNSKKKSEPEDSHQYQ